MSLGLLILGLVLFVGLVIVHEMGHFITARRNGVEAEEFGIFFPPRLWSRKIKSKKGDWRFSINLLPLGGFVKLKGEHDTDTEPGSYGAATTWAKAKIMAAGVAINILVGIVLFMIVAWVGMPQLIPNQFTVKSDTHIVKNEVLAVDVLPGSPASKAGIQGDDQLVALGAPNAPTTITSPDQLTNLTKQYAGQRVTIVYDHHGTQHTATTTLLTDEVVQASQKTDNPKGHLGVSLTTYTLKRSTWSAPVVAVGVAGQFTGLTFEGIGKALAGLGSTVAGMVTGNHAAREHGQTAASSQVTGPVGVYAIMKTGSVLGYQFILFLIAYISLILGIMNLLPIPALDGGRLWLTLFTRGIKKPLPPEREELINAVGFVILLSLIVLITIVDVKRFF